MAVMYGLEETTASFLVPQLGCGLLGKPEFPLSSPVPKLMGAWLPPKKSPILNGMGEIDASRLGSTGSLVRQAWWVWAERNLPWQNTLDQFVLREWAYTSSGVASHGWRSFDPVLIAPGSDLLHSPTTPYDPHNHKITCFFCLAPSWAGVAVTTFHPARCIGLLGSGCFHVVTKSCFMYCLLSKIKKIVHSS